MLFSERDIDALRILRWCQYAAPDDMARVFGDVTIANLEALRLVRRQKQRPKKDKKQGEEQKRKEKEQSETVPSFLTLTAKGDGFLSAFLSELPPKAPKTYTEEKILRRVRFSKLTLTAYRAGFSIFSTKAEDLRSGPSLFLPVIARGRLANPWSSSRIAAITRMGDTLAAVHYVCPGIGKIFLTDELNAFSNNTSQIKAARRVIVFGGESYRDILTELEALPEQPEEEETGNRRKKRKKRKAEGCLSSYGEAYEKIGMDIHLLPCDDTGALQLRLMSQEDYRRRLTEAALLTHYQPPPEEHPEWDAMFEGRPFVMAADMNLRRVQKAILSAQKNGLMPIAMAALPGQAEAVLNTRYRNTSLARVFTLSPKALGKVVDPTLYEPPARAFSTEEGDTADVPLI